MKFLFLFFSLLMAAQNQNIDWIRKNYQKSVTDKKSCEQMLLKFKKEDNSGIRLAYLGALQSIWAKHTRNPIEKLKFFKKGTQNIDQYIRQQPDNLEARLIRYSIQTQSPAFLGYRDQIEEDKKLLQNGKNNVEDIVLREMIKQILNI